MSRIGKRIINLPSNVQIKVLDNNMFSVKGPLGEVTKHYPKGIEIVIENNIVKTERFSEEKQARSSHGTTNALINNAIIGVTKGFDKELNVIGVGYKWAVKNNSVELSLGFSHPVNLKIPSNIKVETPKPTEMIIKGVDKELVGLFAAQIRSYKLPEPYKGKGITYKNEKIIRKEGKAAGK